MMSYLLVRVYERHDSSQKPDPSNHIKITCILFTLYCSALFAVLEIFEELVVRHILVIKIVLHVDFWSGPRYARKNNLATYFVSSLLFLR